MMTKILVMMLDGRLCFSTAFTIRQLLETLLKVGKGSAEGSK